MSGGELAAMTVIVGVLRAGVHRLPQDAHAVGDVAEMNLRDTQHAPGRNEVGIVLQSFARVLTRATGVAQQVMHCDGLVGARCIATWVEHDCAVECRHDLVARPWAHRRGLVVGEAEHAVSQHGESHGVFRRALHREPKRLHGLAAAVEPAHEKPNGLVEELRYGQSRVVGVAQALEYRGLDAGANGGANMQYDLVLEAEYVFELSIVALCPNLRGQGAFLESERQAQPFAGRLHRALEGEVGTAEIAQPHRERCLVAERICDRGGQPLGQRPHLVLAADQTDRLHGDNRLLCGSGDRGRPRCRGRRIAGRADMVDGDRVLDILELLCAAVDEADVR